MLSTQNLASRMSNSSSDVMVWVKEAGVDGAAFRVSISLNAIADDLKKAIKKEVPGRVKCDAPDLEIKETIGGDILEVDKLVCDIEAGKQKAAPFYFLQPTGKFRP